MQAQTPQIKVVYNGKNITEDITKYLTSFRYSDKVQGETDELELQLEDSDGNWQNTWIPTKGDKIEAYMGYDGEELVSCGTFEVDEVELSGPPDTVSIKGLAAGISNPIRTKKSYAYEDSTLKEIAQKIATDNGYELLGDIEPIKLGRMTQDRESDVQFLGRVGERFGYVFSMRGATLYFTTQVKLEASEPITDLRRDLLISYNFKDSAVKTYKSIKVSYRDQDTDEVVEYEAEADKYTNIDTADDVLEVRERAENKQQAEAMAKGKLHAANSVGVTGNVEVVGNPYFLAGNSINIEDMGRFSGKWHILASSHTISRSGGYKTDLEIKKVK